LERCILKHPFAGHYVAVEIADNYGVPFPIESYVGEKKKS